MQVQLPWGNYDLDIVEDDANDDGEDLGEKELAGETGWKELVPTDMTFLTAATGQPSLSQNISVPKHRSNRFSSNKLSQNPTLVVLKASVVSHMWIF